MHLEPGLGATVETVVSDADTAVAMGSGSVGVLATPRVVALCEQASVQAVDNHLDAGCTTVGMRVSIDHLRPSIVGAALSTAAELETVEGRRLTFAVSVTDGDTVVARGRVVRVVVETERFLDKAAAGG